MEKEKIVGVHWDQFERANGETNMQRSSTHVYNSEINVKTDTGKIITLPREEVLDACGWKQKYTDNRVGILKSILIGVGVEVMKVGGEYVIKGLGSLIKNKLNSK